MAIHIVRLGSARSPDEGPRLGTVRRPPRGVPKTEFSKRDFYDTWLPVLAPSLPLMKDGRAATTDAEWTRFLKAYRKEMQSAEARQVISLLATLSHTTDFAVGCYCEHEARCHRSALRQLLEENGAKVI